MTGIEALQAMKDGKKVRVTTWAEHEYYYWNKDVNRICDERNNSYKFADIFMTDSVWEVYKTDSWVRINTSNSEINVCSKCHQIVIFENFNHPYTYCPYCGIKLI